MYEAQKTNFARWEIIKDVIDQQIDLMLNYRQSGHPGGSRSKVHYFVSLLLSGAMRWDIRHPEKRFGDRFVLVAGHTAPLVYATLSVFNEAMRTMYAKTGESKYLIGGGAVVVSLRSGSPRLHPADKAWIAQAPLPPFPERVVSR